MAIRQSVPTAAQLSGDFSSVNRQLVNPFTGVPFPNNQIPTTDFAPASVKNPEPAPTPYADWRDVLRSSR